MAEYYLNRGDAPFGDKVWERIDTRVVEAAESQLSGRRLLRTIGPYGTGVKTLPFRDAAISGTTVEGVTVESSGLIPVAMMHSEFSLSVRSTSEASSR